MDGRNRLFLRFIVWLALSSPGLAHAGLIGLTPGFTPIGQDAEFVTGTDAGAGPGSPSPNSTAASNLFESSLGSQDNTTSIDFGSAFSIWSHLANGTWSQAVNTSDFLGLKMMTTGIDESTAPAPYEYGLTSVTTPTAANANVGYGIDGPSHYEFVPSLTADTSTLTIQSDTAFSAFGFYVTGLGNVGGKIEVSINGAPVQELTLSGSSQGGVEFLGYIGDAPIHDFTIVMPDTPGISRDVFGISNILLAGSSVPEPSPLALFALGLAGVLGVTLVRRGRNGAVRF